MGSLSTSACRERSGFIADTVLHENFKVVPIYQGYIEKKIHRKTTKVRDDKAQVKKESDKLCSCVSSCGNEHWLQLQI